MAAHAERDGGTAGGLARERTLLARSRSAIAAFVALAALLRGAWALHGAARAITIAIIGAAALLWAVLVALIAARGGRLGRPVLGAGVLAVITVATLVLAVLSFVLAFLLVP